jgi:hypothetical protein
LKIYSGLTFKPVEKVPIRNPVPDLDYYSAKSLLTNMGVAYGPKAKLEKEVKSTSRFLFIKQVKWKN